MRSKQARVLVTALVTVATLGLGLLNWRAYRPGDPSTTIAQLRYLKGALDDGAAERMQGLFPEGYVFTWALYGIAAANVAHVLASGDPLREELLQAGSTAVERVTSAEAKRTFDRDMSPEYGAFYASWSLYLRSALLRAHRPGEPIPFDLAEFERDGAAFAAALSAHEGPFMPSYPDMAWPADTGVGVAALAIRDAVSEGAPRYEGLVSAWIAAARDEVDPELGALTQAAGVLDGPPNDGPRGESLALLSLVLADADPSFARAQYLILRRHFIDYRFGVPGVLEYPRGIEGPSDVDSGPILLGFSGPATVVGAGAARVHGDNSVADALLSAVEVVGLPVQLLGKRWYAFGTLPVGDAFLAWVRSIPESPDATALDPVLPPLWRLPLHLASLVAALLAVYLAMRVTKGAREKPRGLAI
jgi:hypothetical protein